MTITQESSSRTVRTADWNLHYHEAGEGQAVILLHGSGVGASGWANFSENIFFLAQRFHVYAVDMPGWGASDPCTIDQLDHVIALEQFMDTLGIEKAALVGNSMGGVNAIRFAVEHPDRVSHLITMGPAASRSPRIFSPGDGPTEGLKILFEGYKNPTPETMRRLVEVMCFDKSYATEELCQRRSEAAGAKPEHLLNFLKGLPKGGPIPKWFNLDDLLGLQVPSLLIHGRDDRVVPYEHSLVLLAHIPNSRLVVFNHCGHWAMIEHAAEFNRLVTDFVTNN